MQITITRDKFLDISDSILSWSHHLGDRGRLLPPLLVLWYLEALITYVPWKEYGTDTDSTSNQRSIGVGGFLEMANRTPTGSSEQTKIVTKP